MTVITFMNFYHIMALLGLYASGCFRNVYFLKQSVMSHAPLQLHNIRYIVPSIQPRRL
jgi:hypothetical protein